MDKGWGGESGSEQTLGVVTSHSLRWESQPPPHSVLRCDGHLHAPRAAEESTLRFGVRMQMISRGKKSK